MRGGRWLGVALCLGMLPAGAQAHHTGTTGARINGTPMLLVPPRNGDGYITIGERYLAEPRRWKSLRSANNQRKVQVGRSVRIPLELLPPACVTTASSGAKPSTCSASFWMKLIGMSSWKHAFL